MLDGVSIVVELGCTLLVVDVVVVDASLVAIVVVVFAVAAAVVVVVVVVVAAFVVVDAPALDPAVALVVLGNAPARHKPSAPTFALTYAITSSLARFVYVYDGVGLFTLKK